MKNFDRDKFKALVHYVCNKAEDPSVLGSIKLNKVVWYSDSIYYKINGDSITGETYIKRQFGPVPRHIVQVIDELGKEGKVRRGKVDHFGHMKHEFISIEEPKTELFSSSEISIIDRAYEHVCLNHTAMSISEETHGIIWQLANIGEEIPLYTSFASETGEIDENDVEWAKTIVAERLAA